MLFRGGIDISLNRSRTILSVWLASMQLRILCERVGLADLLQPISACYCEAPTWKYFGEVDAQNKFQGRSFEIRPTGVAHAELIIPRSWTKPGTEYPAAGAEYPDGLVVEHYSCVCVSQ